MTRQELIERLKNADGADRELDCWLGYHVDLTVDEMPWRDKIDHFGIDHAMKAARSNQNVWSSALPAYTASIDAAVALVGSCLPGWAWRVATCCVADDAWVQPDFNCPVHGERLRQQFDEATNWVKITDVDLRPSGRPAIALCISVLTALEATEATTA